MHVRRIAVMVACLALTTLGLTKAVSAAAPPLACGTTITHNTTLTADVGPCSGNGLIITASNVTLNLGGHHVFGAGVQSTNNHVGVLVQNASDVTVSGPGSVTNFSAGVAIFGGQSNTVRNVTADDNNATQWVNDHPGLGVYGDGIAVNSSSYNTIENNTVSGNGPFSGIAIFTSEVGHGNPPHQVQNQLKNNTVTDNNVPDVCPSSGQFYGGSCTPGEGVFSEDIGIRVEGPAAVESTVSGNAVSGSGRDGISVLDIGGPAQNHNVNTHITGNSSHDNGAARVITDPIYGILGGDGFFNRCFAGFDPAGCPTGTVVVGNTFDNNPAHGLNIDASQGNTVIGNEASGNGYGNQTAADSDPPYTDAMDSNSPPCNTNTWQGNTFGTVSDPCIDHNVATVNGTGGGTLIHQPPRPGGRAVVQ